LGFMFWPHRKRSVCFVTVECGIGRPTRSRVRAVGENLRWAKGKMPEDRYGRGAVRALAYLRRSNLVRISGVVMARFLIAAAALIVLGPIAAVYADIHPAIPVFIGLGIGCAGVVWGASPMPSLDGEPSPGAETDALLLSNYRKPPPDGTGVGPFTSD
jgi:hypothetical protein